MYKGICSIIFVVLAFIAPVSAQEDTSTIKEPKEVQYDIDTAIEPLSLEKDALKKYKEDKDFDYTENLAEESWWTKFKSWVKKIWYKFLHWLFGDFEGNGFLSFLIQVLPYLIILGLIIFLGWLFYRLNPGASVLASKEKPQVFFTEEEEIIRSQDIKKLIEKALENSDYRLAVRYYYLLILKRLTDVEIIEYEFDKTNSDYFKEIISDTMNIGFKKATNLYDYIWYGNFSVTKDDYQKAQQIFVQLESDISKISD